MPPKRFKRPGSNPNSQPESMANTTSSVYNRVIDDIGENMRQAFIDEAGDHSLLTRFQEIWREKMLNLGVLPIKRNSASGGDLETPVHDDLNVPVEEYETLTAEMLFPPTPTPSPLPAEPGPPQYFTGKGEYGAVPDTALYNQPGKKACYMTPTPSPLPAEPRQPQYFTGQGEYGAVPDTALYNQPGKKARYTTPSPSPLPAEPGQPQYFTGQGEYGAVPDTASYNQPGKKSRYTQQPCRPWLNLNQRPPDVDMNFAYKEPREEGGGISESQPPLKDFMMPSFKCKWKEYRPDLFPNGRIPQQDGSGEFLSDWTFHHQASLTNNLQDNEGSIIYTEDYNSPYYGAPKPQQAEAIEDDDDDDDLDCLEEEGEALSIHDLVLTQFEKVSQTKGRKMWKCILKAGIIRVNDKDILFTKYGFGVLYRLPGFTRGAWRRWARLIGKNIYLEIEAVPLLHLAPFVISFSHETPVVTYQREIETETANCEFDFYE